MDKHMSEVDNESIIIRNASNFWRYHNKYGFDLTRQNDHQTCFSIRLETTTMPIDIDPTRPAVVIFDKQNFFIYPALRSHDTGVAASKQLLQFAIPAARKADIQIIWVNWGFTEDDIEQAASALKRVFARELISESKKNSASSETIYKGLISEIGNIILPSGEHINMGRLLMRDT
ncbi:unnamed protein product [Adineta steineri]|uniref:Uncharacterized protein n=1 Tax=Adineta steineri TaxID=433720 RepID=A0A819U264_9BILA|nr:unnamed protein product [Adineta steineri]CAF1226723.1 unnamed protein product [Adineta steineri]CAF4073160.1 unnamed protein product [Adineta steineri]CAF4095196.1 unnamed protein product [Adineta steineri]